MKATFDNTVSILVKAYLNDTLEHSNYCACAVGNLIADKVGAKIIPSVNGGPGSKYRWLHPHYEGGEWYCAAPDEIDQRKAQIIASGYSAAEIKKIENAFESQKDIDLEDSYHGLMAVVDVLAEIHGIDLEQKESAKALFVK